MNSFQTDGEQITGLHGTQVLKTKQFTFG